MPEIGAPTKRYLAHAGFVTTPRYFDDSPQQFLSVAPKGTGVIQRVLHIPNYEYELGQRARNFDLLEEAAICLGLSHAEVVGQVGTNWVHCNGTTPDDIKRLCDKISRKAGARFLMAGMCIVEGLQAVGAKRIAVANGYYRQDWMDGINRFLEQAGFEILWSGNVIDQGLYDNLDQQLEVEEKTLWDYPARDVIQACYLAHKAAPNAQAVVQTGSGFRTLPHIQAIEGMMGIPLISSDVSLYWAMLRDLNTDVAVHDHGQLMATLG